ncbi:hypothetical protein Tco_0032097 [Tanacetum coccineum]
MYEKRSKSENKGKVPTEMELVLEQTQQCTSYEVSVSAEGVEELERKVKIKGENKEAIFTLRQKPDSILQAGNPVKEILLKLNLPDHRILKDGGEGALMSMGRVFKTRLRRRGVKQSGEVDIVFKIVDEYTIIVVNIAIIVSIVLLQIPPIRCDAMKIEVVMWCRWVKRVKLVASVGDGDGVAEW